MGNRAVITTYTGSNPQSSTELGVYLHYNGGRDSVEPFLAYCKAKGYRPPETDCYGWARLCQIIGNFFGGGLSLGVDVCARLDCNNGDNGTYIIKDWRIVDRKYFKGTEQQHHDFAEMLTAINDAQPESERLSDAELVAIYDPIF